MKRVFSLFFIFVFLLLAAACGEEDGVKVVKESVTKEIDAEEGGTVKSSDGSTSIEIPADALGSDTTITMTIYETSSYSENRGEKHLSKIIECEPSGTVFRKPIIIKMTTNREIKNKTVAAAVYSEAKGRWSYNEHGAYAVLAGRDAAGDPIMQTAAGDPIMLNAAGDPIMMSAAGDPIMMAAAGDPIMLASAGDPIMMNAAGDPIMMTTGHFTAYTFFILGEDEEEQDSGDEGDDDEDEPDDDYVPECGNGIVDDGEECDNGEDNSDEPGISGSSCRTNCRLAVCGDSVVDTNEACDDGNTAEGDYCSADCQAVTGKCGDGRVQSNEACDKADPETGDGEGTGVYCSDDCERITGRCGDGVLQENEECDNGESGENYNGKTTCNYGEPSCVVCTAACKKAEGEDFYGQDAQYTNKCTQQSFTVRTIAGDNVVFDNNTGLRWQQSPSESTYTWDDAAAYCAGLNYGGKTGWRVPNPDEISTISDRSADTGVNSSFANMPTFDEVMAEETPAYFWTSKVQGGESGTEVYIFLAGLLGPASQKEDLNKVLCVYGSELPTSQFTSSNVGEDIVITDSVTGLQWQKTVADDTYTWQDALDYCENLEYAGYDDWRLPNVNELAALMNFDKEEYPYTDFPDEEHYYYWSSSAPSDDPNNAWLVLFKNGYVSIYDKSYNFYVRCVR